MHFFKKKKKKGNSLYKEWENKLKCFNNISAIEKKEREAGGGKGRGAKSSFCILLKPDKKKKRANQVH